MDSIKNKYEQGIVNVQIYKDAAIKEFLREIESIDFEWNKIGKGTFGDVFEIKHPDYDDEIIAAKVVLDIYATESETKIWPTLIHENILPLEDWYDVASAHTLIFLMPKYSTSLSRIVTEEDFLNDPKGVERAISWLNNILNGLNYLHKRELCHLDLKLNNILLNETDTASICDFGFVTSTQAPIKTFGSPFQFRPPEALVLPLHGKKFDVWTVGVMTLELFTQKIVQKSVKRGQRDWPDHVYPYIQTAIQPYAFKDLMERISFPTSVISSEMVVTAIDFIAGCLNLDQINRPDVSELLEHKLFGGRKENISDYDLNSIWQEFSPDKVAEFLHQCVQNKRLYNAILTIVLKKNAIEKNYQTPEDIPKVINEAEKSPVNNASNNQAGNKPVIKKVKTQIGERPKETVELGQSFSSSKKVTDVTDAVNSIVEELLDAVEYKLSISSNNIFNLSFTVPNYLECPFEAYKPTNEKLILSNESSGEPSSVIDENDPEDEYDDETDENESVFENERAKISKRQKFCIWLKDCKTALTSLFTACVPVKRRQRYL